MSNENTKVTMLLEFIIEHLDIPRSYYEKAVARHKSLGDWLCRPESTVADFQPYVSAQGSFRYGTVNRPLRQGGEYDLDNVTRLTMAKTAMTQKQLKQLYGAEIKRYAEANGMLAPVEEKDRCWRLSYADDVAFHLDTLPCVPEEPAVIAAITERGVPAQLAALAVAITDRRHPQYEQITTALLSSNPRGFARWFEAQARPHALPQMRRLVEQRLYASVENVPPYEWKTPLQRSIQILKRHRDVMFEDDPASGPISMIITNLAAQAYGGEANLWLALTNILERMPQHVRQTRPYVPNPADPAEDYADKWSKKPVLKDNFWAWHKQATIDIARLLDLVFDKKLPVRVNEIFRVRLTDSEIERIAPREAESVVVRVAPVVHIPSSAPKPWGR